MIVNEHSRKQFNCFGDSKVLIFIGNEFRERLLCMLAKDSFISWVKFKLICIEVVVKFRSSQDSCNFLELIIIIAPLKERFFLENHSCEHCSQAPNIQTIIIILVVYKQLRSLKVSWCNSHLKQIESQIPSLTIHSLNFYQMDRDITL